MSQTEIVGLEFFSADFWFSFDTPVFSASTGQFMLCANTCISRKCMECREITISLLLLLLSIISPPEIYFDTEWFCSFFTLPWKNKLLNDHLSSPAAGARSWQRLSRCLQEMVGDILKLARVGVEFQRAQSPVSSCNFALLSCLLLAWITVVLMKPRKSSGGGN